MQPLPVRVPARRRVHRRVQRVRRRAAVRRRERRGARAGLPPARPAARRALAARTPHHAEATPQPAAGPAGEPGGRGAGSGGGGGGDGGGGRALAASPRAGAATASVHRERCVGRGSRAAAELAHLQPQGRAAAGGGGRAAARALSALRAARALRARALRARVCVRPLAAPRLDAAADPEWCLKSVVVFADMESMGGGGWGGGAYPRLEWGEGDARRAWPVPPPRPEPPEPMYVPPKSMGEVPPAYAARAATLRDSAKKGPEPERASPAPPAPHHPPPPPPPPPVRAPDPPPHRDKEAREESAGEAGAAARVAPPAPDGLSERPPAAVLLLVLGMVMTVGLGGMLGCRMSAARRRLRRGKPFAHDADYLVNGMYL